MAVIVVVRASDGVATQGVSRTDLDALVVLVEIFFPFLELRGSEGAREGRCAVVRGRGRGCVQ